MNCVHALATVDAMYPIGTCCYDAEEYAISGFNHTALITTIMNEQGEIPSDATLPVQLKLTKAKWCVVIQGSPMTKTPSQRCQKHAKSCKQNDVEA